MVKRLLKRMSEPIRITASYAILGALWIKYSDELIAVLAGGSEDYLHVQTLKGWFFVLISSLLIFLLVRRAFKVAKGSEERLRRVNRSLRLHGMCNNEIVRATDETVFLNRICQFAVDEIGYRFAWVGITEHDENKTIRPVTHVGHEDGYLDAIGLLTWADVERGRGPAGTAIRTQKPSVAQNILVDRKFVPWRSEATKRGYASCAAFPLLSKGKCFGVLVMYAAEPKAFNPEEVQLLQEMADDISFGIQVIRTRKERKLADEALQRREQEYRSLFEDSPIPLWEEDFSEVKLYLDNLKSSGVGDLKTYFKENPGEVGKCFSLVKMLNVNKAAVDMFEATGKEELLDRVEETFSEESYDAYEEGLLTLAEGKKRYRHEGGSRTLQGKQLFNIFSWNVAPDSEETLSRLVVSILDVSELKLTQGKLEHLNTVLRALRSVNQLIVGEKSTSTLIQGACDALVRARGYHAAWLVVLNEAGEVAETAEAGLGEEYIPFVEQLAKGALPMCLKEASVKREKVAVSQMTEACLACALGKYCCGYGVMTARLEYGSRTYGFISVCAPPHSTLDAEEQSLFQEVSGDVAYCLHALEMEESQSKAEKEKEELRIQLLQSQKMEALGKLAGGIAHDFNNLLSVIMGYTDIAMRKLGEQDPLYSMLSEVEQASKKAANLTSQLLFFSRKKPVKREALNLNDTAQKLHKMIERLVGENVHLRFDLHPGLWNVFADPGTMDQVIMNLVLNARDAMPEGGTIAVVTDNAVIDQGYCRKYAYACPGQFVCLSVADSGIGMDEVTRQRVFEPFFTTKEEGKGTGLGLPVVFGIVKQHEGWINVESEPGKGTTFTIYLPALVKKGEEVILEELSSQEHHEGHGERILIVEDDEMLRGMLEDILSRQGYVTFCARNADRALELFAQEQGSFDLVFSDVGLPGKSGVELITELLSRKSDLRVLLSSGYIHVDSQREILQEKGYPFVGKPYNPPDLLKVIAKLLKQDRPHEQAAQRT